MVVLAGVVVVFLDGFSSQKYPRFVLAKCSEL